MSGSEPPPPGAKQNPLVELALGASWLVGLSGLVQLADQLMGPANLGVALLGAIGVDIAARRAGARWDVDDVELDAPRHAARRVVAGAAVALGAGAVVLAACRALGWCHVDTWTRPSAAFAFAVARSAALATRDELLFRGIPLFTAARAGVPAPLARAFSALVSGAAILLVPGATFPGAPQSYAGLSAVTLAVASGWLFASLWGKDRGAWAAVGAHAAWMLLAGSTIHGGIADIDWTRGELAYGAGAAGAPAWAASVVLIAASLALRWLPWPSIPPTSRPPS